jgi:uncharacterized protein YndB with AHSA1/START domain
MTDERPEPAGRPERDGQPDPAGRPGRSIELEVEVDGTPEEVWRAIATGPGISAWYVPHEIDEHAGGSTVSSFGPEPEMQIPGTVVVWEPPHRVVFAGVGDNATFAFEWLVEARDGGSCVVRLVNSGFGSGDEWDAQYDGMSEGWLLFLLNLQLHLAHFRGRQARSLLPSAMWKGRRGEAWARLLASLGLPAAPQVGQRIAATSADAPPLAGTVVHASGWRLALVLDDPAPGTAFLAVEGDGDEVGISIWSYVYGDDRDAIADRDEVRWRDWLASRTDGA